jgi:hypothetical protein
MSEKALGKHLNIREMTVGNGKCCMSDLTLNYSKLNTILNGIIHIKVEISKENKYIHISHNHILLISSFTIMLAFNALQLRKHY